jgi:hypothetical protein
MSATFNDTTNYKGLVQLYEREIGANRGDISGSTDRLKEFASDVNSALDDFVEMAIKSSGTWQFDDTNFSDYPIITTNLVQGQRDYSFTSDETGNLVLDIYKVLVADADGKYRELTPRDAQSEEDTNGFWNGENTQGSPHEYDKTGNGIFLNPIPNNNVSNGLKVYINREASYFAHTDTIKKPGVPGIFHKYFALRPAQDYARRNNLANHDRIQGEVLRMEQEIQSYFGERPKDERRRLQIALEDNK